MDAGLSARLHGLSNVRARLGAPALLGLLSALSLGGYLLASWRTIGLGFPLDDAWIHQTYARNLAQRGEWAFLPGEASAGSTSPLWTLLLAAGHALGGGPYAPAYLLGWAILWGLAACGWWAFRRLCPARAGWAPWAGALLALEWHLAWAAGSGMETLLFGLLALAGMGGLAALGPGSGARPRLLVWTGLGALAGLSAWVRPDGITLLAPAVLVALAWPGKLRHRLPTLLALLAGFALCFLPYLLFNLRLDGCLLPNTFFAKQAEYAAHRSLPLARRAWEVGVLPLIGAGLLLLPGFASLAWRSAVERRWERLAGALWCLGYLGLYAWRLPATYQHGRYAMPAMPVFFLWGLAGVASLAVPYSPLPWKRILSRAWALALAATLLAFWGRGAAAYAWDVAVIESEMVAAARWVQANTEPEALVAAHDIGALGYFGERRLLDLAGLVSPQVIPMLGDEAALAEHLEASGADYLVAFPGWYPQLVRQAAPIYATGATFSPALGGENLTVYRWMAAGDDASAGADESR